VGVPVLTLFQNLSFLVTHFKFLMIAFRANCFLTTFLIKMWFSKLAKNGPLLGFNPPLSMNRPAPLSHWDSGRDPFLLLFRQRLFLLVNPPLKPLAYFYKAGDAGKYSRPFPSEGSPLLSRRNPGPLLDIWSPPLLSGLKAPLVTGNRSEPSLKSLSSLQVFFVGLVGCRKFLVGHVPPLPP